MGNERYDSADNTQYGLNVCSGAITHETGPPIRCIEKSTYREKQQGIKQL